jgi:two-component system alkaline phosphatase synthesis response regulator PhoP
MMDSILAEIRKMTRSQRRALIEEAQQLMDDDVELSPSADTSASDDGEPSMPLILIRGTERRTLSELVEGLRRQGYPISEAVDEKTSSQAQQRQEQPQIVLELILPQGRSHPTPILVVTAEMNAPEQPSDPEEQANETQPFCLPDFLACIKTLLQEVKPEEPPGGKIAFGDAEVNFTTHRATRAGQEVKMSTREFDLLRYFWQNRSFLVSRQMILSAVWGEEYVGTPRTVDNFIVQLRQKFEPSPREPIYFHSTPGKGYRFTIEE